MNELIEVLEGGPGSGNYGHRGRKGKVGGSLPGAGWPVGYTGMLSSGALMFGRVGGSENVHIFAAKDHGYLLYRLSLANTDPEPINVKTAREAQKLAEEFVKARMPEPKTHGVISTKSAKTDSDPALTENAIINHALAKQEWGNVAIDGKPHMFSRKEPAGEGELVELWHGTTKTWNGQPVHEVIAKGGGLQPSSSGAFGAGVYLAPGANKSLGYGDLGQGNAMVRMLVRPGKTLTLTPKVQEDFVKWRQGASSKLGQMLDESARLQLRLDKLANQADALWERQHKATGSGRATIQAQIQKNEAKYDAVARQQREIELKYKALRKDTSYAAWDNYAKAKGYDSIRYVPNRDTNPIAALRQSNKDTIGFINEEWLVFDPARITVLSVTYTKPHQIRGH